MLGSGDLELLIASSEGCTIKRSAIIVSHGQPSDPLPAEAELAALTGKVASQLHGWQVTSATLANPGALENALSRVGPAPMIYPLFMTDGWFVRSALPKRIGEAPAHILPPLGGEPDLPELVARHLETVLRERDWAARDTKLLVASHGSGRSTRSKQATEAFVDALAAITSFDAIHTGYIEETPYFGELTAKSAGQVLCLPFFAAYGGHVKEDITDALNAAEIEDALLDPIGTLDAIPAFITVSLERAARAQNND